MAAQLHAWIADRRTTWPQDREVTIGRSSSSDIRSTNPWVSRHHGLIRHEDGRWTLHDASSRGTFVDGRRIDRIDISDPVRLHLGDPEDGEVLKLRPVEREQEQDEQRRTPLPAPARLVLSGVIVLVAGFLTTTLLKHLMGADGDANDLLANLGFTWLTFFSTVDDLLERKKVSLRLRRWGRAPTDGAAPRLSRPAVGISAVFVLAGTLQIGGFVGGVSYYTLRPEAAFGVGPMIGSAVIAGCVTLYFLGTWFGRRYGAAGRRLLLVVAIGGSMLDAAIDVTFRSDASVVEFGTWLVLWTPLWAMLAWLVGLLGMRRGQTPTAMRPVAS